MALWEIRQLEQPPLRIEIDDDRNLAQEFRDAVLKFAAHPRWKFWNRPSPYWQITPKHELPIALVVGVLVLDEYAEAPEPVVGFRTQ